MTTPANPADLITWLRAQLDDDEQMLAALDSTALNGIESTAGWDARAYVERARAEVDAKRRILDLHGHDGGGWDGEGKRCNECGGYDVVPGYGWKGYRRLWPCQTIRLLALPFADRSGYREEWRP